jgi:hypothetical protein
MTMESLTSLGAQERKSIRCHRRLSGWRRSAVDGTFVGFGSKSAEFRWRLVYSMASVVGGFRGGDW